MRKLFASVSFFLLCCVSSMAADGGGRECRLWNFGWEFHRGDVAGVQSVAMDHANWVAVDLPHDFLIEQPWVAPGKDDKADNSDEGNNVRSRLSPRGFKAMGVGWYRKTFVPDEALRGKRVLLDFEGIMLVGDVYVNGQRVGGTDYGYLGFDCDISHLLKFGEKNVVAVRADTREPENSRWYTGGGLFRDVHLIATDPVMHFTRHSLKVETPEVGDKQAVVRVQSEVQCQMDSKTKALDLRVRIEDETGASVVDRRVRVAYRPRQKTFEYPLGDFVVSNPRLWDTEHPHLYKIEVSLLRPDSTVADEVETHFGIRTIEFSPAFGLKLNGKKVLLKGIANHHTLGALGAAAYPRAIEKRIRMLKAFGFNHIRTSHNPYSESLLELCDKYGILVVDELYDKWLDRYAGGRRPWVELWQHDIPEFIKRDRNHPSVVVWSLGNELQTYWDIPYADWGVTPYRMQKELLRRYDSERPVTVAMHPRGRDPENDSLPAPLARVTDIAAYNYRYMYFPGDGKRYPYMIFYQSEASTAAMGPNYYEMDLDKVLGLAYWGGIDYLGESQGWPEKGWAQGFFDISLQPKPAAYLVKSMFVDEPLVHIGVFESGKQTEWNGIKTGLNRMSENWNRTEGESVSLYTYTNADEVELKLNGKSLGRKANPVDNPKERNQIRWNNVTYVPGVLEALAYRKGKLVARHKIETTGKAVALRLETDKPDWTADGMDLQHVRITAIDRMGRRVPGFGGEVRLSVSGEARLVAVGNGNMSSDDLNVSAHIHLYDGTALAILRAGKHAEKVTFAASCDSLKEAKIKISAKETKK